MDEPQFVTFQRFNDKNQALELGNLFSRHKIEYVLEDNSPALDSSFGGGELLKEYAVKIRREDFSAADELLIHATVNNIDAIDKDYYLFGFTDDELMDVIVKKDEWGIYDYLLAQRLLMDRGKEINPEELHQLREKRIEELAKPEKHQTAAIIAGYIFAFLGGFIGIVIGWYLSSHKKTLPNGERVSNYLASDRRQGKRIMVIGIVVLALGIILKIYGVALKS